jgi:hypothetical protein
LAFLTQQLSLVQGQLSGEPYLPYRTVSRKLPDGSRARLQEPMHVRKSWFRVGDATYFSIRYGAKPLALDKTGNTTVDRGKISDLPGVIDTLIQAVMAGELDAALTAAVADRKKNFGKRKTASKAS